MEPQHELRTQTGPLNRQLLADGTGPFYHDAHGDDLPDIIDKVMRALTL
jgi:hypothetical protein